jgi:hypothetical protein
MTKTKDFLPLLKLYHTIIYDSIALSMSCVLWLMAFFAKKVMKKIIRE